MNATVGKGGWKRLEGKAGGTDGGSGGAMRCDSEGPEGQRGVRGGDARARARACVCVALVVSLHVRESGRILSCVGDQVVDSRAGPQHERAGGVVYFPFFDPE